MSTKNLFGGDDEARDVEVGGGAAGVGAPRFQRPVRDQQEWEGRSLDMTIPVDHTARMVWAAAERMDLSAFYAAIKATEGHVGRPPIDPRILFALWVYATLDGVGSARHLADLCEESAPYRWICGGVGVNHHALSDFRTGHPDKIRQLLVQHVASLRSTGLVELKRVTQDGIKVRACAGTKSFRRKSTLKGLLKEAKEQVAALERDAKDPTGSRTRQEAARERAAQERAENLEEALKAVEELEEIRSKTKVAQVDRRDPSSARASTTDAEARAMRMPDGGTRPAYNVQIVTDTKAGIVVDVGLAQSSADQPELAPRLDAIRDAYGKAPEEALVDAGYFTCAGIEHASAIGTKVYMPVRERKHPPKNESPSMSEYRARMETPEGKAIFKQRGRWAEWVNALARNRGLTRLVVRGRCKVLAALAWYAIAHNIAVAASRG
jgi:transposase